VVPEEKRDAVRKKQAGKSNRQLLYSQEKSLFSWEFEPCPAAEIPSLLPTPPPDKLGLARTLPRSVLDSSQASGVKLSGAAAARNAPSARKAVVNFLYQPY
jgi:hypothetical protein